MTVITQTDAKNITPIIPLTSAQFTSWLAQQEEITRNWVASCDYSAKAGATCLIPDASGRLTKVLIGVDEQYNLWSLAGLPATLPQAKYELQTDSSDLFTWVLGWQLATYQYQRYCQSEKSFAKLVVGDAIDLQQLNALTQAVFLTRDLINTPSSDMHPAALTEVATKLAHEFDGKVTQIVGDKLLKQNYPAIHAVGRAGSTEPCLIDLNWGMPGHPKLTLVGKGVCFDSGGYDLKNSSGMRTMKKDMGGSAHVLGLAYAIMATKLPVRLRVLIPAVENMVASNAYRPGDVISMRDGKQVEIENTDAEGRLVVADALIEAVTEQPDLIIDYTTLTGAARIALGTELPAMFCNSDNAASQMLIAGNNVHDPVWHMPLYKPYRMMLDSSIADMSNCTPGGYGGAITAGLFLQEFVPDTIPWFHFDVMAWNLKAQPGRPEGGEAMGLRAVFEFLQQRYQL